MNLTHLRAFHYVATYGSYGGAAKAVGLSQPTLSAQVKLLENSYAAQLLQRDGRGVSLTHLGQQLLIITNTLFAAENQAHNLLSNAQNLVSGQLRIAVDAPVHAVGLMQTMAKLYPGVSLVLSTGNSATIRAAVISGTADVGITADPTPDVRLGNRELTRHDLVGIVPAESPFATAKRISTKSLHGLPIVVRETGSVTRTAFENALAEAGAVPSSVVVAEGREAVHSAVLAGLGIGAIGEAEFSHDPRLALVDFKEKLPALTEHIVYRQDRQNDPLVVAALAAAGESRAVG